MDPNRRPQLPALSYLADVDKVKREEDAYQNRNTAHGTPRRVSASAGASPTYHYPPGPPPPYSHAHGVPPTNTWPAPNPSVHTPPESRRTSENEKDGAKQRQSLPSISEALGIDKDAVSTTAAPPALQPTQLPPQRQPQLQSAAPPSPSPSTRCSFPMEPPQPPSALSNSHSYSQYSQYRTEPAAPPASYPEPARTAPVAYPPAPEAKPPLHLQTSQPSSGSMGPPPSTFSYGYTPFPPRYTNPTPPSTAASGPIYQPSVYSAVQPSQTAWKGENRYDDRNGQANYGDNVKRHLDFYDLEAAVNEIAAASGILSDFSRRYGDRMHQTQRSGATLNTLPGLVEVDDMINKSRAAHDSLIKIRDVVLQQQAAFEQQAADQRQQHKLFDQHPQQHQPEHHEPPADETKAGGFAGVDTKKRRGRAAPPGRCHSCNRAETPEWRRGPDGARTLCNACGLHYAKLTRKKGANNSTNVGSSNLRPKETQ